MSGNDKPESTRCLDDEQLLGYLDGQLPDGPRAVVESHLVNCSACRESLAWYIRLLNPAMSAEEKAQLEQIGLEQLAERAKALHREEVGRRLRAQPPVRRGIFVPWRLAASIVAFISVSVVIWFFFVRQSAVEQGLVALKQAYAQERPLEARLTGGFPYAPYETRRGAGDSTVNTTLLSFAREKLTGAVLQEGSAEAHHALGLAYLAEHQYDEALEHLESAFVQDPDNPRLDCDMGTTYLQKGQRDESAADFARAIEHFTRAWEQDSTLLEALFNRALCYQKMFLFLRAEADWQQYLELDPNSPWADEARRHLDVIKQKQKAVSQSQDEIQQKFLDAYRAGDEATARQLVDQYLAHIEPLFEQTVNEYLTLSANGAFSEATEQRVLAQSIGQWLSELKGDRYYQNVVEELSAATPQQRKAILQAQQLFDRARAQYRKSEYQSALALYRQARAAFAATGQTTMVELMDYWIGNTLCQRLQFKLGAETLMQVAATGQARQHNTLRARALVKAGMGYVNLDQPFQNEQVTRQGLKLYQDLEHHAGILDGLVSLAWDAEEHGDYEQALKLYQQAGEILYQYGWDLIKISQFYALAAKVLNQMQRYPAAVACQEEAVRFALQGHQDQLIASKLAELGLLYGREGQPATGLTKVEAALTHAGRIADEITRQGATAYALFAQGQLQAQQGQSAQAIHALNQALRIFTAQGNHYFAAQVRQAKVKPLIERREVEAAEAELNASLNFLERTRRSLVYQEQRNKFYAQASTVYETMTWFQFFIKHDPVAAFNAAEMSRARSLLDLLRAAEKLPLAPDRLDLVLSGSSAPMKLAQIQAALPTQIQLVEYAVTQNHGLIIWVVASDRFHVAQSSITGVELTRLVEDFRRAIERKSKLEIVNQLAERLHDLLIQPVKQYLVPDQQLCFIPDKSLYYVPFAALRDPVSGTYLIEQYALLSSPSASVYVQCLQKARPRAAARRSATMLSVGNPWFNRNRFPRLPELREAELEAQQCAQYYPGAKVLTQHQATESVVTKEMPAAETVNLAAHSLVDEYTPMFSRLILSPTDPAGKPNADAWTAPMDQDDGVLHAYEIYSLSFSRTQLVVLSTCHSGVGRYYQGEGVVGIARPFLARGVPAVVGSLWAVESRATAQLIERFHQQRQKHHQPISQALRRHSSIA
jgi:CHAT domain-containing protein/Tfp pilus assembly protein PilF